jgi:hypothetical protein
MEIDVDRSDAARKRPSGEKATSTMLSPAFASAYSRAPVAASQTSTSLPRFPPPPEAMSFPSGENATVRRSSSATRGLPPKRASSGNTPPALAGAAGAAEGSVDFAAVDEARVWSTVFVVQDATQTTRGRSRAVLATTRGNTCASERCTHGAEQRASLWIADEPPAECRGLQVATLLFDRC